ncbi:PTS glucose transporter subunit IIA [Mycoplasma testudineum]|uniref:PTS glucose transporter subunit IIA n=1 Tax=Mycoplasma testudineum TaxID=244584 RepID=UPI0024434D17|nr:PTS glucose transporter subunit IIA [Mycoplasma testudineum]
MGIETSDKVKVLIHIGIDTVRLFGHGFAPIAKLDQKVKQGQLICAYSPKFIIEKVPGIPSVATFVTIIDVSYFKNLTSKIIGPVKQNQTLFKLEK